MSPRCRRLFDSPFSPLFPNRFSTIFEWPEGVIFSREKQPYKMAVFLSVSFHPKNLSFSLDSSAISPLSRHSRAVTHTAMI